MQNNVKILVEIVLLKALRNIVLKCQVYANPSSFSTLPAKHSLPFLGVAVCAVYCLFYHILTNVGWNEMWSPYGCYVMSACVLI